MGHQRRDMLPSLRKNTKIFICPKILLSGVYIGILSMIFGFAMTWHIFWLAIVSFAGIVACLIIRLSGKMNMSSSPLLK